MDIYNKRFMTIFEDSGKAEEAVHLLGIVGYQE